MTVPSTTQSAPSIQRGWAHASASLSAVAPGTDPEQLVGLLAGRPARGVLARGGGCSYGDAALNAGGLLVHPVADASITLDPTAQTLTAGASATFGALLQHSVAHGYIPGVLPGTRHLTVGGALACDVHGKNHRRDGSIARWVEAFDLMTADGRVHRVTPQLNPDLFRTTIGGMGLSGIILRATLRLIPISSTLLHTATTREPDLDAVLARLETAESRYAVAWVDGTASGRSLGRGVVDLSDHEPGDAATLSYRQPGAPRIPPMPVGPVGHPLAAAFNTAWFHAAPRHRESSVPFSAFFHRLDALGGWNNGMGPRGFLQYQFVVPLGNEAALRRALETVGRLRAACFLGTLKRFGPGDGHPLSFPIEGWCLALDIALPSMDVSLAIALDALDETVADAGGRVYLAKDSRLSRRVFARMYPGLGEWQQVRNQADPDAVFRSDLGRRLGLCR